MEQKQMAYIHTRETRRLTDTQGKLDVSLTHGETRRLTDTRGKFDVSLTHGETLSVTKARSYSLDAWRSHNEKIPGILITPVTGKGKEEVTRGPYTENKNSFHLLELQATEKCYWKM